MKTPKISVIMPVYNSARYLKAAMESILNQTFKDFEFIIIDDGSTDETQAILDCFADPRIRRFKNEKNLSLVKSLNMGLKTAQGEFIARMDGDDVSYFGRFEKQVNFLEENPEVGVLGTSAAIIDSRDRRISVLKQPASHELIFWKMFFECAVIHPTVMMRRELIIKEGGYDPAFIHIEDTELWTRLIKKTKFANLQEILFDHRLHKKSIADTQGGVQYQQGIVLRQRLFENVLGRKAEPFIAEWFSRPETLLSPDEIKKVSAFLEELHSDFIRRYPPDDATKAALREDFEQRLETVKSAGQKKLVKYVMKFFKKILPGSWRHRIKTSKIGRYFKNNP